MTEDSRPPSTKNSSEETDKTIEQAKSDHHSSTVSFPDFQNDEEGHLPPPPLPNNNPRKKNLEAKNSAKSSDSSLHDLALKAQREGNYESASVIWRGILSRHPEDLIAANNFSILLRHLGRLAESEAVLRQAIQYNDKVWTLWFSLGQTLSSWDNEAEALDALVKALELAPEEPSTHYAMGHILLQQNEPIDALFHFRETFRLAPQHSGALTGAARALMILGEKSEAELLLIRATEVDPFDAVAHCWLAHIWLSQQNSRRGWLEYEWRFKAGVEISKPPLDIWQGEPLRSRILLVDAEQGTAETLFFVRFLKLLPKNQTILRCRDELITLIRSSGLVQHVWPKSSDSPPEETPTPNCWTCLGSLPLLTDSYQESKILDVPYLRADPTSVPIWNKKLKDKPSIGISWKGGLPLLNQRERGISLYDFEPLFNLDYVKVVCLQPNISLDEKSWLLERDAFIPDKDFDYDGQFIEVAALIEAISLTISVPNALAHLAGSLAKPAWVISHTENEWMWKNDNGDSAWYPSVEVFTFNKNPKDAINNIYEKILQIRHN